MANIRWIFVDASFGSCRCQKINFNDFKSGIIQSPDDVMEFHLSFTASLEWKSRRKEFHRRCLLCALCIPTCDAFPLIASTIHTRDDDCAKRSRRCCRLSAHGKFSLFSPKVFRRIVKIVESASSRVGHHYRWLSRSCFSSPSPFSVC